MALEPITRQEKIIAGQDLTPITRMEKFLKQYGGGSGGVTSWNDLTDKPFGEVTTVKEVLAECQPEFNSDGGAFVLASAPDIVVGKTYIVSWNGVDYSCVAQGGTSLWGVGNLETFGLIGNGEPFAIACMQDADVVTCGIVPLDGSTTLTISIRQEVTEVKKISGKYVEGMGWAEKTVSGKVVVEETEYKIANIAHHTLNDPNGNALYTPNDFSFEIGKSYRITIDGIPYTGVAESSGDYGNYGDGQAVPLVDASGNAHGTFATAMGAGYTTYFYYDAGLELGHTGTFIIEEVTEVETIHPIDEKLIVLTSPNGTQYNLSVADDGTLSAVAAT